MSNIKSKEFYQEAENTQKGWGHYLKAIDKLKDKVENQKNITLSQACWVLYGEGHCSFTWREFKTYARSLGLSRKRMIWECWKGLFDSWLENTLVR
jgi:hypothetical protein